MKFLADQNVSKKVVEKLREAGFDIVRVEDVLHCRATDNEILAEAEKNQAVIVSHDQDFSTLLATSGSTRPSLVNLRVSFVEVDRLSQLIAAILVATEDDLDAGAVVTVDDTRVRIRRLPIG